MSLGAKVQREVRVKDKVATHLVAARGGTAKVNEARRFNEKNKSNPVHLVTPDWLWCCAERWEKAEEAIFPLYKSAQARMSLDMDGKLDFDCFNLKRILIILHQLNVL